MSIQGKHIIVTGGGSGVGKATAHKLAKEGAKVTILGRTEEQLKDQNLNYKLISTIHSTSNFSTRKFSTSKFSTSAFIGVRGRMLPRLRRGLTA